MLPQNVDCASKTLLKVYSNGTFDCVEGYYHYANVIGLVAGIVVILSLIALIVGSRAKK